MYTAYITNMWQVEKKRSWGTTKCIECTYAHCHVQYIKAYWFLRLEATIIFFSFDNGFNSSHTCIWNKKVNGDSWKHWDYLRCYLVSNLIYSLNIEVMSSTIFVQKTHERLLIWPLHAFKELVCYMFFSKMSTSFP